VHSALERFQIGDDLADLIEIEVEFRHGGIAGDDPLAERFFERLDRIAGMSACGTAAPASADCRRSCRLHDSARSWRAGS
jgi:hypothetical protein